MSDVDINWFGNEFLVEVNEINIEAAKKAAFMVERSAKISMGRGQNFITKGVSRGRKTHRPSWPGQPPAVDYGILKSSVTTVADGVAYRNGSRVGTENKLIEKEPVSYVGSDIDNVEKRLRRKKGVISNIKSAVQYGFFLEVGTKNMFARPWLRPALKKNAGAILKIFQKANS